MNVPGNPYGSGNVEHDPVGTQLTDGDVVQKARTDAFLELGFSTVDALLLAVARWPESVQCRDGVSRTTSSPLHPGRVKRALDSGMTHGQAVAIFA